MSFVSASFEATGESGQMRARRVLVGLGEVGGGAFVGTVKIKWQDKDGVSRYATDAAGTEIDLTENNHTVLVDFGVSVRVSLVCSAYTSGTIKASMTGNTMSDDR